MRAHEYVASKSFESALRLSTLRQPLFYAYGAQQHYQYYLPRLDQIRWFKGEFFDDLIRIINPPGQTLGVTVA